MKRIPKNKDGITLISLVVTIIILLILAGISIGMLSGDNSILSQAGNAKTQTDIAEEKEILQTSALSAMGKSKYGEVTKEKLDNELDKNIGSANYSSESVDDGISVTFTNSKRIYIVDSDGNISEYKPILATAIEVDKATDSVGVDDTITLTATTTPSNSAARIAWVLDEGGSYATLNTSTGEVTGTQQGENKVKIKAKAINPDGTEIESNNTCVITITASRFIDYSYVDYPVEYTDVYTGTTYHKDTAWRLVTKLDENEVTNLNVNTEQILENINVDIISTGIPAKLRYDLYTINATSGNDGYNIWKGSDNDVINYKKSISQGGAGLYGSSWNGNPNMYAVAGLYYNFEKILFNVKSGENLANSLTAKTIGKNNGGFAWMKNGNSEISAGSSTNGSKLFRASSLNSGSVSKIRSVTLEDIKDKKTEDKAQITASTDKRPGLFRLDAYDPDKHSGNGDTTGNSSNCSYWLASPFSNNNSYIHKVESNGKIGNNNIYPNGLRPVISLSGITLKREAGSHVWKIVETLE